MPPSSSAAAASAVAAPAPAATLHALLQRFTNLVASTDGRDKVFRILQYLSRLVGASLNPKTTQTAVAAQALSQTMTDTRRVLRTFRFVGDYLKVKDAFRGFAKEPAKMMDLLQWTPVLSSLFNAGYMFLENVLLLEKCKFFVLQRSVQWNRLGNFCWMMTVLLGLLQEFVLWLRQSPSFSRRNVLKFIFDFPIAYNLTTLAGFSNSTTGFLGTVSSYCMFLDVWEKTK